jgi:hypothetical protein
VGIGLDLQTSGKQVERGVMVTLLALKHGLMKEYVITTLCIGLGKDAQAA